MSSLINGAQIRYHMRLFFQRQQTRSRSKLYGLLLEEVEGLLLATHQLPLELGKLRHRLRGLCCYLNIEQLVIVNQTQNLVELRLTLQALHDNILAIADEI
ncbi:hypothetical protein [Shewanella sp.]|uniref:hypothetical protein n=1 Tax=Shewanella sp. TaxID=50422 RepID=UPI001ECFA209|nr:hypothetical protein [Shewanella sp.]NRB25535.1 hypothetical protein [Shewanella sp.]